MKARRPTDKGFVLLNALVVVLALSLIATLLLRQSGASLARQTYGQTAAQAALYLEAAESLLLARINAASPAPGPRPPVSEEGSATAADFVAEERFDVPVDRGRVAAVLWDRGGFFNINWLSASDSQAAFVAFQRLTVRIGLPLGLAQAIRAHLGEAPDPGRYGRLAPDYLPRGGPIVRLAELRAVPGVTEQHLQRLARVAVAAPPRVPLNVNAAPKEVLPVLFPAADQAGMEALALEIQAKPAETIEDFLARVVAKLGEEALEGAMVERIALRSYWYEAEITSALDGLAYGRAVGLERTPSDGRVHLTYRAEQLPVHREIATGDGA